MTGFWTFLKTDGGRATFGIIAFVSLAWAITSYLLNKRSKKLIYQRISTTRVLTVKEELAGRVEIYLDGRAVREVGLLRMKITNTHPTDKVDFVRPIKFSVLPGQTIMDADFVEVDPPVLAPSLQRNDTSVTIEPLLLNEKNSFQVKLLIANFGGTVQLDSRIEGVELKPGRKIGALGQVIVEIAGGLIFSVLLLVPRRVRLDCWPGLAPAWTLTAVLLKWSKSFRYSADAPNDYK